MDIWASVKYVDNYPFPGRAFRKYDEGIFGKLRRQSILAEAGIMGRKFRLHTSSCVSYLGITNFIASNLSILTLGQNLWNKIVRRLKTKQMIYKMQIY